MSLAAEPAVAAPAITDAQILQAARSLGAAAGSTLPDLMVTLLSDDAGPDEVACGVAREPMIAARLLKVANSPYYGLSRAVSTLEQAVQLLGLDAVKGIAAAACFDRLVTRDSAAAAELQRLREHSLATGCAAQALARRVQPEQAADLFLAGLLHDLGIAVQIKLVPDGLARWRAAGISGRLRDEPLLRESAELLNFGVTHEHCAGVVFGAWKLPDRLAQVVAHHHDAAITAAPADTAAGLSARLLALAHGIALGAGYALELEPGAAADDAAEASALGIDDEFIGELTARLPQQVWQLTQGLVR